MLCVSAAVPPRFLRDHGQCLDGAFVKVLQYVRERTLCDRIGGLKFFQFVVELLFRGRELVCCDHGFQRGTTSKPKRSREFLNAMRASIEAVVPARALSSL